jgi:uncharacterized membrane protein
MAESEGMIVFAGQYADLEEAKLDFEGLKELKHMDFVGNYEAALFTKTEDGKVKIVNTDATERTQGAKIGAVTGAVLAVIFPPSLLAGAAVGAGAGALVGNFTKVISRSDIKEIGEMLDTGQAGIVFIGEATLEAGMRKLLKRVAKEMKVQVDEDAEELKRAIDEAVAD